MVDWKLEKVEFNHTGKRFNSTTLKNDWHEKRLTGIRFTWKKVEIYHGKGWIFTNLHTGTWLTWKRVYWKMVNFSLIGKWLNCLTRENYRHGKRFSGKRFNFTTLENGWILLHWKIKDMGKGQLEKRLTWKRVDWKKVEIYQTGNWLNFTHWKMIDIVKYWPEKGWHGKRLSGKRLYFTRLENS